MHSSRCAPSAAVGVWGSVCLGVCVCVCVGGCLPRDVCAHNPPWTEFLTHTCENITFSQLLLQMVKMFAVADPGRGSEKHEIHAVAFGGHFLWLLFTGSGGSWTPHPLDPLLVQAHTLIYCYSFYYKAKIQILQHVCQQFCFILISIICYSATKWNKYITRCAQNNTPFLNRSTLIFVVI